MSLSMNLSHTGRQKKEELVRERFNIDSDALAVKAEDSNKWLDDSRFYSDVEFTSMSELDDEDYDRLAEIMNNLD